MPDPSHDARHYSIAAIDLFWAANSPVVLPISGTPTCMLDVNPDRGTITLTTSFTLPEPDVARWRNISFRTISSDLGTLAELVVVVDDNLHAAYGLLTSIADQLQLARAPLAYAVATSIANHRTVFAGRSGLTQDKELGLFGELLVLEYLIHKIGSGAAVEAWQGPMNEEHDFVLNGIHLEVKTTSGEHRRHMIHGFMQLVPLRGVPLSLVSIQLTRSNQAGGRTLPQIVSQVRHESGGYRPKLDNALNFLGWKDDEAELYDVF